MKKPLSKILLVFQFIMGFGVMGAILFIPAGTYLWIEGWLYLFIQFIFSSGLAVYLWKHDQELLKKRMDFRTPKKGWDLFLMSLLMPLMIFWLPLMALDAVRFQWSSFPLFLQIIGFLGIIIALYIIFLAMRANSFLSKIVEIQEKHKVITDGPYRFVRHPMYSGMVLLLFTLPLALGSLYGILLSVIMTLIFAIRAVLEEAVLRKELEGYLDYTKKTRYRLIPGLW